MKNLNYFLKELERAYKVLENVQAYMLNREDITDWYFKDMISFDDMAYLQQVNFYMSEGDSNES